jgi:serine/threonine protein kinase
LICLFRSFSASLHKTALSQIPQIKAAKSRPLRESSGDFTRFLTSSMGRKQAKLRFSQELGTPAYIAPEIWENLDYSAKVDHYSYAITLFEIGNFFLFSFVEIVSDGVSVSRDFAFDGLENEEIIAEVGDGVR